MAMLWSHPAAVSSPVGQQPVVQAGELLWEAQPVPGVREDLRHGYAPRGVGLQHPPRQVGHLCHLRNAGKRIRGVDMCTGIIDVSPVRVRHAIKCVALANKRRGDA